MQTHRAYRKTPITKLPHQGPCEGNPPCTGCTHQDVCERAALVLVPAEWVARKLHKIKVEKTPQ